MDSCLGDGDARKVDKIQRDDGSSFKASRDHEGSARTCENVNADSLPRNVRQLCAIVSVHRSWIPQSFKHLELLNEGVSKSDLNRSYQSSESSTYHRHRRSFLPPAMPPIHPSPLPPQNCQDHWCQSPKGPRRVQEKWHQSPKLQDVSR